MVGDRKAQFLAQSHFISYKKHSGRILCYVVHIVFGRGLFFSLNSDKQIIFQKCIDRFKNIYWLYYTKNKLINT